MIKGIKNKFKVPVCLTFCQSGTKKEKLKTLIKENVKVINSTGLIIVSTICDQSTTNVSVIKALLEETRQDYVRREQERKTLAIEFDGCKFFPLFDPPHLLKGMRNNLLKNDLKFMENGKIKYAKWEHLEFLLNEDIGEDDIRLVNKLTELHVNKDKIPRMKVKFAAQVFSQSFFSHEIFSK